MGQHKSFDRQFVLLGGAVMTNGGALDLSRGEIGFFDTEAPVTKDGVPAISSFKGLSDSRLIEIRYKESDDTTVSRSKSSKSYKSFPFTLENVKDIRVSAPTITEAQVDEVVVGWNGIDEETALRFRRGQSKNATVELSGEAIGLLGYPNATVQVPMFFDAGNRYVDECEGEVDFCAPIECNKIVQNAIDVFKQFKLRGGVPVTDYVDISPIRSCADVEIEIPYRFYSLTICDTGDDSALALIRQQYPSVRVERVNRSGAISTYELLQLASDPVPVAFEQTLPSIIKGCEDCPAGYDATVGGFVYAISLEDDGVDQTSLIEALPNAVADSAIKAEGQAHGVGFYTVVLSEKLTSAQISTFVNANDTATVDFVSSVEALCTNDTVTTATWTAGSVLNLTERDFYIDLPDINCNGLSNRLEELQSAYPELDVRLADSTNSTRTVTLTGTSGTANISVGGVNYLATFATNLTTTASNFVSAHAAAIASATGAVVTSSGSVIKFSDATAGFPAITVTNVSTDLGGTVGTLTPVLVTGGCQTRYVATVQTNMRDNVVCDPIFLDSYSAETPLPYDNRQWKPVPESTSVSTDCLCGIKLTGKLLQIFPTECVIDDIAFVEDSVKIRFAGGWISEVREGIGAIEDTPFHVEYLNYASKRTHMGYSLINFEKQSRTHFSGDVNNNRSNIEKFIRGVQTNLNYEAQYIDYAILIKRDQFAQSMGQKHESHTTYHIQVEVGRHDKIENLLNSLAAQAGIKGVKAFGSTTA